MDMAGWSVHSSSSQSLLVRWEHCWVLGKFSNVDQEGSYLGARYGRRACSLAKEGDLRSKHWFLASVKNLQWGSAVELGGAWDSRHKRKAYGKAAWMHRAHCSKLSSLWSAHRQSFTWGQWRNRMRVWIVMRVAISFFWPFFFLGIHSDPPYFTQEL